MTVAGNQSSAKVTGLKNGTSYTFSVKATNAVGTGPAGQTTPVTPTSAIPDPPTSVSAKAQSDGSILVSWTAANGQGHPISYYSVTATPSSGAALAPVKATGTSATLTTAQGLTLGTSYTFTVTSTSSTGGTSKPSTPSNAVTAHTVPLSVSNLVATPGNDQISLTWSCDPTTAACSGGSTVTKFDVTVSPAPSGSSSAPVTASTGQSSYNTVVTGLVNGVAYTVSVSACNALGCTPTTLSGSITPATVPAPPSITGSVSGTTISWSWNIPNANGSAVTSFVVSINGSEVANSMATSYSAGYGYAQTVTISVTAVNGVGQSPASTNSQRTATPPPPPPPSPSVTIKLGASATTPGCTSSCYWIDVSFAHMPANSSFDLVCYQNGSKYFDSATYGFTYKSNSSGSGSYAPTNKSPDGCASGTGKVYVTINSVSSKSITT